MVRPSKSRGIPWWVHLAAFTLICAGLAAATAAGVPGIITFYLAYMLFVFWGPAVGIFSVRALWDYRLRRATPRASIDRIDITGVCYGITIDQGLVRLWAIPGPLEGNNIIVVLIGLMAWLLTAVLIGVGGLPWSPGGGSISTVSPILWGVALVSGSVGALCAWVLIRRPNWTEVLLESQGPVYIRRQTYTGDESEEAVHREAFGKFLLVKDRNQSAGINHTLSLKVEGRTKPLKVFVIHGVVVKKVRQDMDRLSEALLALAGRDTTDKADEADA
jgi:hypothetical protein